MFQILNRVYSKGTEERGGLTLVEFTVIVGALAVFASVYAFVIVGAITSRPLIIG